MMLVIENKVVSIVSKQNVMSKSKSSLKLDKFLRMLNQLPINIIAVIMLFYLSLSLYKILGLSESFEYFKNYTHVLSFSP